MSDKLSAAAKDAEIARLREALAPIADMPTGDDIPSVAIRNAHRLAKEIAMEALSGSPAPDPAEAMRGSIAMLDCEGTPLKLVLVKGFKAHGFELPVQAAEDAIDAIAALKGNREQI